MPIADEISIPTMEVEADGFITRPETLERISQNRAKPIEACPYPCCEECDKYHGHYCTVPMVVSKQNYIFMSEEIKRLEKRLNELESLVTDEILGPKPQERNTPEVNFTWDDYLQEEES